MPQIEVAKMLMAGEKATIVGPGVVKFEAVAQGLGGAGAMAGKAAGVGAAGKGIVVTSAATASSVPASLLSGKVLGFSLAGVNPWLLLAAGLLGGYMIAKKKYPRLVW
ncbi:MAG: hypothetical protein H7836_07090 [Magnetococcus sp. YQC-3]